MKKLQLYLAIFICSFVSLNAQVPDIQWLKSIGGSLYDNPYAIHLTSDGGFFVFADTYSTDGDVSSTNHGNYDLWGIKLDSYGNIQWEKCYGGTEFESLRYGIIVSDGGYVFAGWSNSNDGDVGGNNGQYDFWIIKIDTTGGILWETNLGGSLDDKPHYISQTNDGGYIAAGYTVSSDGDVSANHGLYDVWVVKLDSNGLLEWEKTYGGSGVENGEKIYQTNDGGYILIAYTESSDGDITSNNGGREFWVLKLDNTGGIEWQKCYGGTEPDRPMGITTTSDNGYIICGQSSSGNGDVSGHYGTSMYHDIWVLRIDSLGTILWDKNYGGTKNDSSNDIINTTDGGYIITGETLSDDYDITFNNGGYDTWVIKIDSLGNLQWQKCVGSSINDYSYSIVQTSPTSYVFAGTSGTNDGDVTGNHGSSDIMIVKLNIALSTTDNIENNITIYPNPANDFINIKIPNSNIQQTIVNLYNCQGRLVKSENLNKLTNIINVSMLPEGFFILQVIYGNTIINKKIVISN